MRDEDRGSDSDQVAADQVGCKRAKRQRLDTRVQPIGKAPAQPRAKHSSGGDGDEREPDRSVASHRLPVSFQRARA
jgi:hypothetical protein